MSFQITRFDGIRKPWEGVGADVTGSTKAAEAIELAGLDWNVELAPLFLQGEDLPLPGKQAVVRVDKPGNSGLLGIVGNQYKAVQNKRAFEFLDGVAGEALDYVSAGTLGGGKKVFLQARLPQTISVAADDPVEMFCLLYNSHDGTTQLKAGLTPTRVRCQNTLMMALQNISREICIRHSQKLDERLQQAENIMALADQYAAGFKELAQHLRKEKISDAEVLQLSQLVFPPVASQPTEPEAWEGVQVALTHETNTLKGMPGTKWAAYNAIALYTDWGMRTRQGKKPAAEELARQQRLQSIWLGDAKTAKDRALKYLLMKELPQPKKVGVLKAA
jgi:phage/plasmid-like protein (TIGR03299 family)